jgi:hypothetical protein
MDETEKPRDRSILRWNSLNRRRDKRNNRRYARISEEHRFLELRLDALELEAARERIAIQLSKKNEKQVLGWII